MQNVHDRDAHGRACHEIRRDDDVQGHVDDHDGVHVGRRDDGDHVGDHDRDYNHVQVVPNHNPEVLCQYY